MYRALSIVSTVFVWVTVVSQFFVDVPWPLMLAVLLVSSTWLCIEFRNARRNVAAALAETGVADPYDASQADEDKAW